MDEIEAALITTVIATEENKDASFSTTEVQQADHIYALNTNLDQISGEILGYTEKEEIEDYQNEAMIMSLLEQDIRLSEQMPPRSLGLNSQSIIRSSNYKEKILSLLDTILNNVSTLRTRHLLRDILDELVKTGLNMEIIEFELFEEEKDSCYNMEIYIKHYSSLSMGGEKYMIKHFKDQVNLSFSQNFIPTLCKRLVDIKVVLK